MLRKKIQRQLAWSVMYPPRVGPSTGHHGRDRRYAERRAASVRRKGIEDNGLLIGLQAASEEALGER